MGQTGKQQKTESKDPGELNQVIHTEAQNECSVKMPIIGVI